MITVDTGDLNRLGDKFDAVRAGVTAALVAELDALARELQAEVKRHLHGDPLHRRTGTLAAGIATIAAAETAAGEVTAGVTAGRVPYARAQEYGATIRPVNVAHLTIPIGEALTPMGRMRFSARDLISGAAGYPKHFMAKGLLFGGSGRGDYTPLFALRDEVILPPRPFMHPALAKLAPAIRKRLVAVTRAALKAALGRAGG
jgi:hypothetical protein